MASKIFLFEEVKKHNETQDCWLIVYGKVYDVSEFMEDHPGGAEVLLAATGKDATSDFEDTGHSDYATEMMEKYKIGEIDASTIPPKRQYIPPQTPVYNPFTPKKNDVLIKILQFVVPLMILGIALAIRNWTKTE